MIFKFLPLMIDNPTHDKTFSSYNFLFSINVDAIFENPEILPRNSKGLQYVGKYHEHIAKPQLLQFRLLISHFCTQYFLIITYLSS